MTRRKASVSSSAAASAVLGDIRSLIEAVRQRAVHGEEMLSTLVAQWVRDYGTPADLHIVCGVSFH